MEQKPNDTLEAVSPCRRKLSFDFAQDGEGTRTAASDIQTGSFPPL